MGSFVVASPVDSFASSNALVVTGRVRNKGPPTPLSEPRSNLEENNII